MMSIATRHNEAPAILRERIGAARPDNGAVLPLGTAYMDERLADSGLMLGGLHKVSAATPMLTDDAAATLSTVGVAAPLPRPWRRQGICPRAELSAAMTRWRIACAPSEWLPAADVGRARWTVELARQRDGPSFTLALTLAMTWVASRYLPHLAIERLQQHERPRTLPDAHPGHSYRLTTIPAVCGAVGRWLAVDPTVPLDALASMLCPLLKRERTFEDEQG